MPSCLRCEFALARTIPPPSFRDGPKDQTADTRLRIGESRDCGFASSTRPGMTRKAIKTLMVRRRASAVSNHEAQRRGLILRDAAKTPLLRMRRENRAR